MRKGLLACPAAAHPGDWCAGEVQRVALEIEHHLHYIRVHDVGRNSDGDGESGDLNRGVIQKNLDGGIHRGGVDQRLVALDVDDDLCVATRGAGGDFGHPLGARAMVASGHHRVAIKFLHGAQDSLVIGGHQHARNVLGATHTLPYVLNHWLLRQPHQRFAWKAAGSVARGNDGQHAQLVTPDRKSTRLNSSHLVISYAVFCLKKKRHSLPTRTTPLLTLRIATIACYPLENTNHAPGARGRQLAYVAPTADRQNTLTESSTWSS